MTQSGFEVQIDLFCDFMRFLIERVNVLNWVLGAISKILVGNISLEEDKVLLLTKEEGCLHWVRQLKLAYSFLGRIKDFYLGTFFGFRVFERERDRLGGRGLLSSKGIKGVEVLARLIVLYVGFWFLFWD